MRTKIFYKAQILKCHISACGLRIPVPTTYNEQCLRQLLNPSHSYGVGKHFLMRLTPFFLIVQTRMLERIHSKFVNRLPLPYRSRFSLTLTERRRFHTATQIFRSLHRLSPPYLHNIFQLSKDITGHVSRNINRLFVPRVFTNYGKRSFFYRGALLWNSLPLSVTGAATLLSFKNCYFDS